jgi:uncharacterized membrane protein YraQ (UPF0718 family)
MDHAMIETIVSIADQVASGLLRMWPYLLLTIPLAVVIQMAGAARYIRAAFAARPVPAIILATLVGAFSPFCSCGVIPVIASLLLGGVPLAPVMSFWVASPSMDPEIFFLSVATLGWELALWRLLATLAVSLAAGFITHAAVTSGWIAGPIVRSPRVRTHRPLIAQTRQAAARVMSLLSPQPALAAQACCATTGRPSPFVACGAMPVCAVNSGAAPAHRGSNPGGCGCSTATAVGVDGPGGESPFLRRLARGAFGASTMVAKFMTIALVLEALLVLYVPEEWVMALVGADSGFAILIAALVGVPLYTSNLAALPMVGALLAQGMDPSAALAFLIAGPMTTVPAMAAVWGLVHRRVFVLYVGFALAGAVAMGLIHHLATAM